MVNVSDVGRGSEFSEYEIPSRPLVQLRILGSERQQIKLRETGRPGVSDYAKTAGDTDK